MATKISTAARNAACDAIVDLIDTGGTGTIEIRSGTQPAGPDTAPSDGQLLGTLTFHASLDAFGAASSGQATANDIQDDTMADADGTATWFRVKDGAGTAIFDGNITGNGGGGDMELNNTSITANGTVSITSFTFTVPASE